MKFIRYLSACIFSIIMILPSSVNVLAYSRVTANATVDGCRVVIDGKISGVNESVEVLLIVGEDVMPLYLAKDFSTSKGESDLNIYPVSYLCNHNVVYEINRNDISLISDEE